ncbi:hypothetical protein B9Z55_022912 [Caenorhabditis nigoni]|uniref:Uncharacterized protein n=1 Tax=Caenorhabditis nigoni TaxID=1611254 RepID=A0A2G5SMI9_9PELO|nr:hypothetical protein B9Z55_022912 [Caenorhabditis nigoni]
MEHKTQKAITLKMRNKNDIPSISKKKNKRTTSQKKDPDDVVKKLQCVLFGPKEVTKFFGACIMHKTFLYHLGCLFVGYSGEEHNFFLSEIPQTLLATTPA